MKRWRPAMTGAAVCAVALLVTLGTLPGCGEPTPQPSPEPSPSPSASASPTAAVAFTSHPPGTASAKQALAVADEYGVRLHEKTLGTANLLAADSTLDVWRSNLHLKGSDLDEFFRSPQFDWRQGSALATVGAAVYEEVFTYTSQGVTTVVPSLSVLTVSDGKIARQTLYYNRSDSPLA